MAMIRVPYPDDPEQRAALFHRAASELSRHGGYEGTPEEGSFHGRTPVGRFAGTYRSPTGSGVLEIHLTKKPFFVPASLVEHELRRLMDWARAQVHADRPTG